MNLYAKKVRDVNGDTYLILYELGRNVKPLAVFDKWDIEVIEQAWNNNAGSYATTSMIAETIRAIETSKKGTYNKSRLLSLVRKYQSHQQPLPPLEELLKLTRIKMRELHRKLDGLPKTG